MFKKQKILEYAKSAEWLPDISPTRLHVPQWWKDGELWIDGTMKVKNYKSNPGIKACVPFLDSMQIGYVITTWTDILITLDDDGYPVMNWMAGPDPIDVRNKESNKTLPVPHGYWEFPYVWKNPYGIKTPKGYSSVICHPLNRNDLPFLTLDGVVDTDTLMYPGNIPFFLKNNFVGEIPKGTPIMMIIPFKRDDWTIKENSSLNKQGEIMQNTARTVFSGYYKRNVWKRKRFE